jgi:hypothetical protein
VEVGNPGIRLVGDASGLQIDPQHLSRPKRQPLEDGLVSGSRGQPGAKIFGKGLRDRLDGFAAVLGIGAQTGYRRRFGFQGKPRCSEAAKLIGPESGPERQGIQHRPIRAAEPAGVLTDLGSVDQPRGFVFGKRPTNAPAVAFCARGRQVG